MEFRAVKILSRELELKKRWEAEKEELTARIEQ